MNAKQYRLLNEGEMTRDGDEHHDFYEGWIPTAERSIYKVEKWHNPVRRLLTSTYPEPFNTNSRKPTKEDADRFDFVLYYKEHDNIWVKGIWEAVADAPNTHWLPLPPSPIKETPKWEERWRQYTANHANHMGPLLVTRESFKQIWDDAQANIREV